MPPTARYHRVVLKISGQSFAKPGRFGIDPQELGLIAHEILAAANTGAELAVVVGGGNMIRGAELAKLSTQRPPARPHQAPLPRQRPLRCSRRRLCRRSSR